MGNSCLIEDSCLIKIKASALGIVKVKSEILAVNWWGTGQYMRVIGENGEIINLQGEILTNPSSQGYRKCVVDDLYIYLLETLSPVSYSLETATL